MEKELPMSSHWGETRGMIHPCGHRGVPDLVLRAWDGTELYVWKKGASPQWSRYPHPSHQGLT